MYVVSTSPEKILLSRHRMSALSMCLLELVYIILLCPIPPPSSLLSVQAPAVLAI
jgi:hypothetical protein